MNKITLKNQNNDSLVYQLVSLIECFKKFSQKEDVEFNLSKINFFYPLLILPIASHINNTKSIFSNSNNDATNSYLNAIQFPTGIDSVTKFQQAMQTKKTFTPISILKRHKYEERERLESIFLSLVYNIIGSIPGAQNAVYYPITELVTNIFDHSNKDTGYIFAQYYPTKKYLDICIIDRGRGLSQSYKDTKNLDLDDSEAIIEVMRGHSTKANKERGYGVRTSKRVICEGLKGEFILVSGNSSLISTKSKEKLVNLGNFYWQGVIVSYRIPRPKSPIDITPYLE